MLEYWSAVLLLLPISLMALLSKWIDLQFRKKVGGVSRLKFRTLMFVYLGVTLCMAMGIPFILKLSVFSSEISETFWCLLFGIPLLALVLCGLSELQLFGWRDKRERSVSLVTMGWNAVFQTVFSVLLLVVSFFLLVSHLDFFQSEDMEVNYALFSWIAVSVCLLLFFAVIKKRSDQTLFKIPADVKNEVVFLLFNLASLVAGLTVFHYKWPFYWVSYAVFGVCNLISLLICLKRFLGEQKRLAALDPQE